MEIFSRLKMQAKVVRVYLPKVYIKDVLTLDYAIPYIGFVLSLEDGSQVNVIKPADQHHASIYKGDFVLVEKISYKNLTDDFIKKQIDILYCDKVESLKEIIIRQCKQANLFVDYEIKTCF